MRPIRLQIIFIVSLLMGGYHTASAATDSLTAAIDKIYRRGHFNGFGVAVVSTEGTRYVHGFGYADVSRKLAYTDSTLQYIASVSKTLTGIALLKAQELGKLRLDDPIEQYLPFPVFNPGFPDTKITIRHLATHTSSIADNEVYAARNYICRRGQSSPDIVSDELPVFNPPDSAVTLTHFLRNVLTTDGRWYQSNSFLPNAPGTMYAYSNVATALAAFVLERATGMSYQQFTRRYILEPLLMEPLGLEL